jgi:hypothetical protein
VNVFWWPMLLPVRHSGLNASQEFNHAVGCNSAWRSRTNNKDACLYWIFMIGR